MMPHPTQTIDDILAETTKELETKYPGFKGRVYFDDSRAWSLFVYGNRLNLPVLKFGAFRNYNGGGEKGPIQHNGREEENTVELGEYFAKQLEKIEEIISNTTTELTGPDALAEKKALKEDFEVDTLSVADFIKEVTDEVLDYIQTNPQDAYNTYHRALDDDFSVVVYWESGFDPDDPEYILYPKSEHGHALVVAIKMRDDYESDGEMMLFPYDEDTGECYTQSYPISKNSDSSTYLSLARSILSEYRYAREIYDEKDYVANHVSEDGDDDWEETIECDWCHEYFPDFELTKIGDLLVCSTCAKAIKSKEGPLEEE